MSTAGSGAAAVSVSHNVSPADSAPAAPSLGRAWYALAVFLLAYLYSMAVRILMTLMVGPIRADLHISDSQFGVLTGVAFSLLYIAVGIPIARISDRWSRRAVIAIAVLVWGLMTGLCGVARNFWELFAWRLGVGAGESALSPAAIASLTDLFPRSKLSRATAVFTIGGLFGPGVALLAGGLIVSAVAKHATVELPVFGTVKSWQLVFGLAALPGPVIAALMLTVPAVRQKAVAVDAHSPAPSGVIRHLRENARAYLCWTFACSSLTTLFFGYVAWIPTFMTRCFGVNAGNAGSVLGIVLVTIGPCFVYAGGAIADRFTARGRSDSQALVGILGFAAAVGLAIAMPLASSWPTMLVLLSSLWVFTSIVSGIAITGVQLMAPPHIRAQVVAIFTLLTGSAGFIVGPIAIPLVTQWLGSPDRINLALAIVGGTFCVTGLTGFLLVRKVFDANVRRQATVAG